MMLSDGGHVGGAALRASLIAALCLAAVQVLALPLLERIGTLSARVRRLLVSASAGISVAYVFIDVLPELEVHHQKVAQAAGPDGLLFAEQRVYIVALLSFVVFYGLDNFVLAPRTHDGTHAEPRDEARLFPLYVVAYAAYTVLTGHLLVERVAEGGSALPLYVVAMGVHSCISAHAITERFRAPYARWGRWVLAAAVLVGWAIGVTTRISEVTFARIFAVLAGGVVITSVQRELSGESRGHFWAFVLGAVVFALVLMSA
jgi:hypothetical protein